MVPFPPRGSLAYEKERSIVTVLSMLHESISTQKPGAAVLLDFVAILGPQIPMTVIEDFQFSGNQARTHTDDDVQTLRALLGDSFALRDVLTFLAESCVLKIKYGTDGSLKSLSPHRLISDWCLRILDRKKRAWIIGIGYGLAYKVLGSGQLYVSYLCLTSPTFLSRQTYKRRR